MGEFAIGQSVPRTEDPKFLMGRGQFLDDITLPRQAHAVVLRSPHAHARIVSLDIRAAQQSAGVVGIFTGDDWSAEGFGSLPCTEKLKRPDGGDMYKPFHPALVTGEVRRVGDPVAFVVAETVNQAKDAAERIEIDYDPLPSVSSVEASAAPGAHAVWDDCPDNICFRHTQGDEAAVDAAFASAAHVISDKFTINRVSANTMEPRCCIGHYDSGQDRYTLYTGLQNPHQVRGQLANDIFHMPETKFRIIPGDIGGSFGMRGGTYPELPLVLWASQKLGRPVKWVCERSEGLMSDDHARDCFAEASLALDADGKFLALKVNNKANVGAYLGVRAPRPPVGNLGTYCGIYATPAVHVDISGYFTNTNCFNPYRGSGGPEAGFVLERLIDKAAQSLKLDPASLRKRNIVPESAMPYTNPLGYVYDCGAFERVMDHALTMGDYAGFEARRAESRSRGKLRGRGLANAIKKTSIPNIETAQIRFDAAGGVRLMMGTISHGQGHDTVFKQILNDRLGIAPEKVTLIEGDTDLTSFGGGTFGSRSTAMGGSAIVKAGEKIVEKSIRIAAHLLEASDADIAFDDGIFTVAGTDRAVDFTAVAKAAYTPGQIPDDMEPGLDELAAFRPPAQNWPSTSHVVEIEIDPETGTLDIARYVVVEDLGTEINPMLIDGQTHGGLAQTIGQAVMEDVVFDADSGQLLSGSFMDYAMPRADDFPMFEREAEPVPTDTNPLGVKGGGELAPVACLPAMFNALDDALASAEVAMPATPERVWRAVGD
jgi:aerobic carbon-monoxide dehydrogenase large subunit